MMTAAVERRILVLLVALAAALAPAACDGDGDAAANDLDARRDADAASADDAGSSDDGEQPAPQGATWTDPTSGLTWQVPPERDPLDGLDWHEAVASCEALELAGHRDWVLPTIDELRGLIRGCEETGARGACPLTHACPDESAACYHGDDCMGCLDGEGPGVDGCFWPSEMGPNCTYLWSSSMPTNPADHPCFAHMRNAHLSHNPVMIDVGTWAICVRGR